MPKRVERTEETLRDDLRKGRAVGVRQLAPWLGISVSGLYDMAHRGVVPTHRIGKRIVIRANDALDLLGWPQNEKSTWLQPVVAERHAA